MKILIIDDKKFQRDAAYEQFKDTEHQVLILDCYKKFDVLFGGAESYVEYSDCMTVNCSLGDFNFIITDNLSLEKLKIFRKNCIVLADLMMPFSHEPLSYYESEKVFKFPKSANSALDVMPYGFSILHNCIDAEFRGVAICTNRNHHDDAFSWSLDGALGCLRNREETVRLVDKTVTLIMDTGVDIRGEEVPKEWLCAFQSVQR